MMSNACKTSAFFAPNLCCARHRSDSSPEHALPERSRCENCRWEVSMQPHRPARTSHRPIVPCRAFQSTSSDWELDGLGCPERKGPPLSRGALRFTPGGDLLSHTVSRAVPSALEGLTSLFGMGRGVTPPPLPPQNDDNRNETLEHAEARKQINRPSPSAY